MSMRAIACRTCRGVLAGCDVLSAPPVPDWPGPHAPYPFPDNVPHRTE